MSARFSHRAMTTDKTKLTPSFWTDHLQYLHKSILAQITRIRAGSKHPTIIGTSIETVIRHALRDYFPHRFSIGTGQIAAHTGKLSPQMDILIYDQTTFPLLALNEDDSVIVCCESVFGCIEIKTKWSHRDIEDHFVRFTAVDRERLPSFNASSSEDAASYTVICVEPLKHPDLKWSLMKKRDRQVLITSLHGNVAWLSEWEEGAFHEVKTENPLETVFQHLLEDCMRKKFIQQTGPVETYNAVERYFKWKPTA